MILKLVIVITPIVLGGCSLFPSEYEFNSQLINQHNGGQVCETINPTFYTESGGDEIISISFASSRKFFDLRPEGKKRSDTAVEWSKLSYSGSETYAILSRPEQLKVGEIESFVGNQVCVSFYPGLFEDDELNFKNFEALSGQQCCGTLSKKRIDEK